MNRKLVLAVAAISTTLATPAFAHVGAGTHGGFIAGFMHPIGGLDHVLAMVAVGLLASQLGGRAIWLVPATFVAMMVVGGALGLNGLAVPYIEVGIAASVFVLGALIAFGWKLPIPLAMAIVGAFAVFHGHAHGTELPDGGSIIEYCAGFVLATATLHAIGVTLGLAIGHAAHVSRNWLPRMLGALTALAGAALLASS